MEIMTPEMLGYDRTSTVFSPDGRLFQVQYAMEAVRRGATVAGIRCEDGIFILADKRITSPLMVGDFIEKIFKVDTHIAIATSGLVADGRKLTDDARLEAQRYRIIYGEPIDVTALVKKICDLKQFFTQYAGLRPFGISLLVGGIDATGPRLFETDPSGTPTEWMATALGEGRKEVLDVFKAKLKPKISLKTGILIAFKGLKKAMDKRFKATRLDAVVIKTEKPVYTKLTISEIEKYVSQVL
jgi:proteasome alpha subunit